MKKLSRWLYAPLGLAFMSSAVLIMGGLLASRRPGEPVFLPAEQAAVFLELQDKSESRTVVLTSFETGNALPAYAPVRVLGGHGPESIRQFELRPEIVRFFQSDTSDVFRMELIERFNIRYIFWGPFERLLGDWQPAAAGYLKEIARQGDYALYQVIRGQP
jgi:hypothetical protein